MLKALLVLQMFTFLSWFFVHVGKWFVKKAKVNFKIYDVTAAQHILFNISKSKDNQEMEFNQLIENKKRYFSFKIMQKMRQEDQLQTSFCFLKKLCIRSNQVATP